MAESPSDPGRPRFVVDGIAGNRLAWFRAWTMIERTMSSWILTAITLIGFGFTIVLVFDELSRFTGLEPPVRPLAPFHFGLALIGVGVAALVIAGWQYRTILAHLRNGELAALAEGTQTPVQTLVYAITIITIFIGVFAFLAVLARAL
jgi:inner membrane protein YidH